MEKLFQPNKLDTNPSSSNSTQVWRHWFRLFSNFINEAELARSAMGMNDPLNKLNLLLNFVSTEIYDFIKDCKTYEEAISTLNKLYSQPKSTIYARHKLLTRQQLPGESFDEYLYALTKLSKDCNFEAVTAEQYCNDYIRDIFIKGIISSDIRGQLLENNTLTLKGALNQANAFHFGQNHSNTSGSNINSNKQVISNDDSTIWFKEEPFDNFEDISFSQDIYLKNELFNNTYPLVRLQRINLSKYTCEGCSKYFISEVARDKHIIFASSELRYDYFKDPKSQNEHDENIINNFLLKGIYKQEYKCSQCGYSFKQILDLSTHIFSVHGKPKLLRCSQCNFISCHKGNLNYHILEFHEEYFAFCRSKLQLRFKIQAKKN